MRIMERKLNHSTQKITLFSSCFSDDDSEVKTINIYLLLNQLIMLSSPITQPVGKSLRKQLSRKYFAKRRESKAKIDLFI